MPSLHIEIEKEPSIEWDYPKSKRLPFCVYGYSDVVLERPKNKLEPLEVIHDDDPVAVEIAKRYNEYNDLKAEIEKLKKGES